MSLQFLHRMMTPATYPAAAAKRAPHILETWLRYSPDAQPTDRDWEDWAENAIMLAEADRVSGGKIQILDSNSRVHTLGDNTPMVAANPGAPEAFMFGLFKSSDSFNFPADVHLVGNNAASVKAVQNYATSPTFLAAAGRRFFVCDAEEEQIEQALRDIHATGARQAFVKTRFKESAQLFTLPEDPSRMWSRISMDSAFEWFLVSHEGMKGALYVQEAFVPTKEYRTIIIGDEVVSGAGCIEYFTPLDNRGEAFDPRIEIYRNRSEVSEDRQTVERYREFAARFATNWAAENSSDHAYSLDLAVDNRTDTVVAIELNPMMNLGLYANDVKSIMDGVIRRFG